MEDLFRVLWADDIVVLRRDEECWSFDEGHLRFQRVQLVNVELGAVLDGLADDLDGACQDEHGDLAVFLTQVFDEAGQTLEGTIKDCSLDVGVLLEVHECCNCTHRPSPQPNVGNLWLIPEMLDNLSQIVPLEPPKGNILSLGVTAACEVECQERDALGDEFGQVFDSE